MVRKKIYNFSVFLTAIATFIVWLILNTVNISISGFLLNEIVKIVISALFSYGFFVFLVSFAIKCIDKYNWLKKFFFSSSFIEGIWVGFYVVTKTKETVLTIEQISQNIDSIIISGRLFETNFKGNIKFIGTWDSDVAFYDVERHFLKYTYECMYHNHNKHRGSLVYNFNCQGLRRPMAFIGYDSDYTQNGKSNLMCKKYCDLGKMNPSENLNELYNAAKAYYEDNITFLSCSDYYEGEET